MRGVIERSEGRWREILPMLGLESNFLTGKHGPCPFCGGKDRFRFSDYRGRGDFFCNQCGNGDGFELICRLKHCDFKQALYLVEPLLGNCHGVREQTSKFPNRKALRQLWLASVSATCDDPVGKYFARRGIERIPKACRYVERMRHPSGVYVPGMIAVYSDADGKPANIHRTFLTGDGDKFDGVPVRAPMSGSMPRGGAIRLSDNKQKMGIAEGIETALSAAQIHDMPVWSAVNAGLLQQWQPPQGVTEVIIFADNDKNCVGQAAAWMLAKRLCREDSGCVEVHVAMPSKVGDWNDVLCETQV